MKTATDKKPQVNKLVAELEDQLGIPSGTSEPNINPLQLAVRYEFDRRDVPSIELVDPHERALERCLKKRVPFESEFNSFRTLVTRMFLGTFCPSCGRKMKIGDSGGNFEVQTYGFTCECGCKVSLTLPVNSVRVSFAEKK